MTPLVLRPRFASAGRQFWILASTYVVLSAVLCVSLATWAISWPAAAALFVVLIAALALLAWLGLRGATISIDTDTLAYQSTAWATPKVLPRAQLVRVLSIGRVRSSLPLGIMVILASDGTRIGLARWLWSAEMLHAVGAALGLPVEHRATIGALELVREIGVDPAYKRNPLNVVVLLAAAAVGVLIAWPIVRAALL
ncbi:MAG TPA: hypothetical protein VIH10_15620 [Kribbella sp.]|jgi:hypothetical protein